MRERREECVWDGAPPRSGGTRAEPRAGDCAAEGSAAAVGQEARNLVGRGAAEVPSVKHTTSQRSGANSTSRGLLRRPGIMHVKHLLVSGSQEVS